MRRWTRHTHCVFRWGPLSRYSSCSSSSTPCKCFSPFAQPVSSPTSHSIYSSSNNPLILSSRSHCHRRSRFFAASDVSVHHPSLHRWQSYVVRMLWTFHSRRAVKLYNGDNGRLHLGSHWSLATNGRYGKLFIHSKLTNDLHDVFIRELHFVWRSSHSFDCQA